MLKLALETSPTDLVNPVRVMMVMLIAAMRATAKRKMLQMATLPRGILPRNCYKGT